MRHAGLKLKANVRASGASGKTSVPREALYRVYITGLTRARVCVCASVCLDMFGRGGVHVCARVCVCM